MEQILNAYYQNNAGKLHKMVKQVLVRINGTISGLDMDEFYSVANDVFADIVKNNRYDPAKGEFDAFFYKALERGIIDELKKQGRDKRVLKVETEEYVDGRVRKRKVSVRDISLDEPVGEDDGLTVGDTLQSSFQMEDELEKISGCWEDNVENYLAGLSKMQRQMVEMKMEGIPTAQIRGKLGLSEKQYRQNREELKSFAKMNMLFQSNSQNEWKENDFEMITATQTMENCKTDKISIASIIKKIDKHAIRFDHPLQRESDQWTPSMKGNLVSEILQGNKLHPLIFAEQIIHGVPIIWDLDGKQRCTNAYSFAKNGYRVSKNIRRWKITYQTIETDAHGNALLDKNGVPIVKNAECDIRGKKFSELPEELRDRFLDYSFNYDQYLNCSEEDIGYHIERYNDGKPMTSPQKGITKLGTEYAEMVRAISNMPFFKDMGGYKVSEFKNGTISRVVVESVMASNYVEDWKKEQDYLCKYLKENAAAKDFEHFEDMVGRLEKVVTEHTADMFDSKDSFLWFGLFSRFLDTREPDKRFIEFMEEFSNSLHDKEVNGITYDELCIDKKSGKARSTKDKYIVIPKMEVLEALMYEYLGTDRAEKGGCFKKKDAAAMQKKSAKP